MRDQNEVPWTASVTRVDPQAHVYLGNLHQGDRITPYTRDTRGRWSRAGMITEAEVARAADGSRKPHSHPWVHVGGRS